MILIKLIAHSIYWLIWLALWIAIVLPAKIVLFLILLPLTLIAGRDQTMTVKIKIRKR